MSLTLGEKLRQAREERGISISEVSEQTRIASLYLESIENDDYKPLPGGIFNKGFVKSYAKFIGIDEQEAMQDYARIVASGDGGTTPELKVYKAEVLTDDRSVRSMLPTYIFAFIILALMTAGILFLVQYIQNQPEAPANLAVTNTANTNTSEISTLVPAPDFSELRVEFRALSETVSLQSVADGNKESTNVTPGSSKSLTAKESIRLTFYRGFADTVEVTLNGRVIKVPAPEGRANSIDLEINKQNALELWNQGTGSEQSPAAPVNTVEATPTPTVAPATPAVRTATTPKPAAATPTPTPVAASTPAAKPQPTTIIVGKPTPENANRP